MQTNFVVDTWDDSDPEVESDDLNDKDFYEKLETEEGNLELELNGQSSTEYKLGPKEIEEIKRVFNKFDKNKLGYIRVQKIIEVFVKVGQNPSKSLEQTLLNQAYKQDGMIYFSEAISLFEKYWKTQEGYENELRSAFKTFDHKDDEKVNLEELKGFLSMHGDKLDKTDIELFTKVIVDKKTKFEDGRMDIDEIMRKITVKTKASSKKNSKSKKSK